MTNKQEGIARHKKSRKRVRTVKRVLALLLILCAVLIMKKEIRILMDRAVQLTIVVQNQEIIQGEDLPQMQIKIHAESGRKKPDQIFLNKEKTYSVQNLIEELEGGKGCTIICNADATQEGIYPIKVELDKKITEKLDNEWKRKVRFYVKSGNLTVKNPMGNWEGNKFRKYDGTYMKNGFVNSKGKQYYLNEEGIKATGWQMIGEKKYLFDENGVLQTSKWVQDDNNSYYLNESGAAVTGWMTMDDSEYFFHQDGRMSTGKVQIGLAECVFDENGKLLSRGEKRVDPSRPMVALTFDDGPGSRTGDLLEALKQYNAHATFFMLGKNVASYPDTVRRMKEYGCETGNHSYEHANLSKMSGDDIRKDLAQADQNIKNVTGIKAPVMRPPYGAVSDALRENAEKPMILWNIDTLDWKTRNVQQTIDNVMNDVKDGDIILMHDIYTETIDAALELIPKLEQEGYQLVTVSELAQAKGQILENGKVYTDF